MEFKNPFYQSLLETHSEFSDNAANNTHVCVETRGKRACTQLVSEWYLIILHLAYTTAIALSMVYFLNGTSFRYEGSDDHYGRLTQSDVTTLISVALVIARTIGTAWQALATWRCVFILLEKNGLSLAETSSIVSLHLPTIKMFYRPTAHSGHAWTRAMAIVILCLAWPAQFSNPIASGSVSWIPSNAYRSHNTSISLSTPAISNAWSDYAIFADVREKLVKESAGRSVVASTFLGTWTHDFLVPPAQRILTHLNSHPNGTIVKNATVPIFDIRELEWVTDKISLPIELEKAVTVSLSGYLNFSRERGPLEQIMIGTAALLKDTPWIPPAQNTLPPAQIFSGTKFAAIYVSRNENHGLNDKYDCRNGKSSFDPLPNGIKLYNIPWNNNQSDCIAVAKLSITAGTTQCYQGDSNFQSEPTCILSSGAIFTKNTEAASDVLVEEVFSAMPEVQALGAALGLSNPETLSGSVEIYLRNSLTQAYQGTWSTFVDFLTDPTDPVYQVKTDIWQPYVLLEARVQAYRVYLWLGLNVLLVASGLLLFALQKSCQIKTVNDPVLASMMMDSSEVITVDKTGLCNATDVGSGHGNAHMRVFLRTSRQTPMRENYSHHKLVPQDIYE